MTYWVTVRGPEVRHEDDPKLLGLQNGGLKIKLVRWDEGWCSGGADVHHQYTLRCLSWGTTISNLYAHLVYKKVKMLNDTSWKSHNSSDQVMREVNSILNVQLDTGNGFVIL